MPDEVEFGVDGVAVWSPIDWSESPLSGLVTLAGDGANPMPPYVDSERADGRISADG